MYYLNKGTKQAGGTGHPFTDRLEYLFCVRKDIKQIDLGLPRLPLEVLPSGQFHIKDFDDFLSADLAVSNGDGTFGASTSLPLAAFKVDSFTKDGDPNWYAWSTDSSYLVTGATSGRYVIRMNLFNGSSEKTIYSEEFIMSNCCK